MIEPKNPYLNIGGSGDATPCEVPEQASQPSGGRGAGVPREWRERRALAAAETAEAKVEREAERLAMLDPRVVAAQAAHAARRRALALQMIEDGVRLAKKAIEGGKATLRGHENFDVLDLEMVEKLLRARARRVK